MICERVLLSYGYTMYILCIVKGRPFVLILILFYFFLQNITIPFASTRRFCSVVAFIIGLVQILCRFLFVFYILFHIPSTSKYFRNMYGCSESSRDDLRLYTRKIECLNEKIFALGSIIFYLVVGPGKLFYRK